MTACSIEDTVKPLMKGNLKAFRYADDLVICCRYEEDAVRVKTALSKRLEKYKLKLNEEKTKMVKFSKSKSWRGTKQESFDFLGFTFYLGRSQKGIITPKVKTCGKRYRSKLNKVKEWAQQIRNKESLRDIWKIFCSKLRGHVQYYGPVLISNRYPHSTYHLLYLALMSFRYFRRIDFSTYGPDKNSQ